ncbi:MAG: amino acid adenylation domain-containing protein, partial [bacterium]|nr:amino acid adenylation domain-containing protein [bacterium]
WIEGHREGFSLSALRQYLSEQRPAAAGVARVPNPRLSREVELLALLREPEEIETAAQLRQALAEAPARGIEPDDLRVLGHELSYAVELSWAAGHDDGSFDVLFRRADASASLQLAAEARRPRPKASSWTVYANDPLAAVAARRLAPRLRSYLEERLPQYMVPSAFVLLPALPRSPSGKVDRRVLPAPGRIRPELEDAFAAPRTPAEEILAGIWTEFLGIERAGVHDNFFELGGDSILTIQIVARAQKAGLRFTAKDLFQHQTIAELAAIAGAAGPAPADAPAAGLDAGIRERLLAEDPTIEDVYSTAPTQLAMFYYRLYAPASDAYFLQESWRIRGALDVAAFKEAWRRLMERHTILRTCFLWEGLDEPLQVVRRDPEPPWEEENLAGDPEQTIAAFLEADRQRGFDFSRAPLMRLRLFRLAGKPWWFTWSYHHVLLDGWSIPRLLGELLVLYRSLSAGQSPELAPVRPYRDYVLWLEGQDRRRAEAFWRASLRGASSPTPLPYDRPPAGTPEGNEEIRGIPFELPETSSAQLESLARRHRLTVNTLVQAAWALVLGRYGGRDDVVFGATFSDRPAEIEGVEAMVGCFINTLAVRVRVAPEDRLLPWLRELQAWNVEMRQYGYVQLFELREWSEVPGGEQLFESILVFENLPAEESIDMEASSIALGPGVELEPVQGFARTHYGLVLVVVPRSRLGLSLAYDARLFDASTAGRMLASLTSLLGRFVDHPEERVVDLWGHSAAERHQLLVEWNDTAVAVAETTSVISLVEAQVDRTPEAVAVVSQDGCLSYRELDRRANRLANHLRALGVGPGTLVGVFVVRSAEMVPALLGVLKAGAAYVPLDPLYPERRLALILEETRTPVVLTLARLVGDLPRGRTTPICLDADWPQIAGCSPQRPGVAPATGSPAYVIYTSGSTGRPKGVVIPERALATYVETAAAEFAIAGGDRVLQFASVTFDTSAEEIFPTLTRGAALVLRSEEMLESPAVFLATCRRWGITVLDLPTAYWHQLVAAIESEAPALPGELRLVIIGGESAGPEPVASWRDVAPGIRLVNTYGPTETTIVATARTLSASPRAVAPAVTIGSGIRNVRAYVLDRHRRPVPMGTAGELCLGGPGLAQGYLHRPALTAERFVPDRWSGEATAGTRLYRTGDRVRRLPSGELDFLGRIDHQVKVRGLRLELGEIEAVLAQQPSVVEAAVLVGEGPAGGDTLVACLVGSADVGELRSALREVLPHYMVPASFVVLDALPLTAHGKVDRAALSRRAAAAPAVKRAQLATDFAAPRTVAEEMLAEIWTQLLGDRAPGSPQVGVDDNFFDLGGHSLLAVRVISRVRQAFGVEIALRELFAAPTVAGLAARIEDARRAGRTAVAPPLEPLPRDLPRDAVPLSFAQQRLWFLDRLKPGGSGYNLPMALGLQGVLRFAALERALVEIVRRHESLRTTFDLVGEEPVQRIRSGVEAAFPRRGPNGGLPVVDLGGLAAPAQEHLARRLARWEAERPFDLTRGPLLRATLLRLAAADHVLLLTMHHVTSDAWSMEVLSREVGELYRAFCEGVPSPAAPLPIQYADFAHWQRRWLRGEVLEAEVSYWREQLSGAPALIDLPCDRPRPAVQRSRGAAQEVELPGPLHEALRGLGRGEGATLFMTLLAAFQVLLSRLTGGDDLSVGTPVAGRNRLETEGLIGFFVNTLVLRGDLSRGPSFREFLRRVREAVLSAHEHQEVPFEKLVEELHPERSLAHSPLFQVMFLLQNAPQATFELPGLSLRSLSPDNPTANFDLTLALAEGPAGMGGAFQYRTDLFDAATIRRWAGQLGTLLAGIVDDPDECIVALPLLSPSERHQLLVEWAGFGRRYPGDGLLHQLFEVRAERTPDAVAMVFGDRLLSYRELNLRADRLARHLRGLGVAPEVPVGIAVERVPEVIVGLLGILKA